MKISFEKRFRFWQAGKNAAKRNKFRCPYTRNSEEAYWWHRGYQGKKAPVNPLVYMHWLKPGAGTV